MQNTDYDVKVLNGLITTTVDSVDGYREAARDASNERFRSIFFERADEREDVVLELQTRVRELGGDPESGGTTLAGVHRAFMGLKDAVTGSDDDSIIAEVERGEDHIKHKYEDALNDGDLSQDTVAVIRECFSSVREGHDQMSNLKHGLSGNTDHPIQS
jgi:uncharacterized protein (TIGR02284 family)